MKKTTHVSGNLVEKILRVPSVVCGVSTRLGFPGERKGGKRLRSKKHFARGVILKIEHHVLIASH